MSLFRNPGEEDYEALIAENSFIHDVQLAIERSLGECGMTQVRLAEMLGVSEARVSQILGGSGRNLQARTVARIAHALGRKAFIDFVEECADWEDMLVEEMQPTSSASFSTWMAGALEALDRHGTNDNGWAPTSAGDEADGLVAA